MAVFSALRRPTRPRSVARILAFALVVGLVPQAAFSAVPARQALAQGCPVISGYVYYDINDNGIKEAGEPGLPAVPMQLKDAAGATVAITSTDGSGFYAFDRDLSGSTPLQSETHTATFAETNTDWTAERTLPQFDPALGTLDSVEVTVEAAITSSLKAESLDTAPQTITAEVSGSVSATVPGTDVTAAPLVKAGDFAATAYDGATDFAGTSGHDFGSNTATDSSSTTVNAAGALAAYIGSGSVTVAAEARATSRTTGSGNVVNEIRTVASAEVTLVYRYRETECLDGGTYTIVEVEQPDGYGDGLETSGNVTAIPGTRGSDTITVTLSGQDSPNNNFGELSSSLHGCVYVDANENGVRDASEPGIPNVTITLGGSSAYTQATAGDGCYLFPNLPPGSYTITEEQPGGFRDCLDSIGTQGGTTGNDFLSSIRLPANVHGRNNNFGECLVPTPTPTGSPTATGTATGTATPPGTGTGTPENPTGGAASASPTSGEGVVSSGAPTPPSAPSAGSGFFERTPDVRLVILGFAIFAASGWMAFLALGRAKDQRDEE